MNKYRNVSNKELLVMDSELDCFSSDLCTEICDRAGLLKEWTDSNAVTFESVFYRAVKILKEDI